MFKVLIVGLIGYTIVGTSTNVEAIKKLAPSEMTKRNWTIIGYEGFQYGSWWHNGGKVWYHVCNTDNPSIQYRVNVSMWNGELQYYYGQPEILQRFNLGNTK